MLFLLVQDTCNEHREEQHSNDDESWHDERDDVLLGREQVVNWIAGCVGVGLNGVNLKAVSEHQHLKNLVQIQFKIKNQENLFNFASY